MSSDSITDNELRLVLIGCTATGKSATANTILGEKCFVSRARASSVTKTCQVEHKSRFGHDIVIVDTPGAFDTKRSQGEIAKELIKCIAMSAPGPHAFVMVLQAKTFTELEQNTIQYFEDLFGERMYDYMFLLFTRIDDLEEDGQNLEEVLAMAPENIRKLIDKCGQRYVGFNNRDIDENKKEEMAMLLIDMIKDNVDRNGGTYYTPALLEAAEKELQKREQKKKKENEKEKVREEIKKEVREEIMREVREEVKELREEMKQVKEEIMKEVREEMKQVKEEIMREVRKEIKEVRKEMKQVQEEIMTDVREEIMTEVTEEITTEVREEIMTEVREEVMTELREEIMTEVREEIMTEVREEIKKEVREEIMTEVREEIMTEVGDKNMKEVREEINKEVKEEIMKEVRKQMKKVRGDIMTDVREEIMTEVREEIMTDVTEEMKNQTSKLKTLELLKQQEERVRQLEEG